MFAALFGQDGVMLTGVEQDPDEPDLDRVYVGPRYHWRYVLVAHDTVALDAMGHTFTTLPRDAPMYQDTERCAPQYLGTPEPGATP